MHVPDHVSRDVPNPGRRGRSGQLGQPRAAGGAGYAGPCRAARVRAARHVRPALRADLGPDRPFPRRRPPAREPGPPAGTRRAATRYQCRSRRSAAGCPGVLRRRPERRPGNAVLDPDAVLRADGGASRPEVSALLRGSAEVAKRAAMFNQPAVAIHPVLVNGAAGAVVTSDGEPVLPWASRSRADGSPKSISSSTPCGCAGLAWPSACYRRPRPVLPSSSSRAISRWPECAAVRRSCAGPPRGRWVSRHRRTCRAARRTG